MNDEIIRKKKKFYQHRLFYVILILSLAMAGFVYSRFQAGNKEPQYETAFVQKGTLTQTVDATGNVESANEIELRFESSGKLAQISKKANDSVKAGEVLASLVLNELNAKISQAQANVDKAQADLDKLLAGNTQEYIDNLKAKVDQASANLENIKASYADDVSDAESAVKEADNDLQMAFGGEESFIVKDAYDDTVALLHAIQTDLAESLTATDNVLGIDNKLANDDFQDELANQDKSKLGTAENRYYAAKSAKNDADIAIDPLFISSSHDTIDWTADTTAEGLLSMKELLTAVDSVLEKTSPIGNLSQTELDTLKTSIQTTRSNIANQYIALVNQQQSIITAKNSYQSYLIAYDKAVANLDNIKKQSVANIAAYEALVAQAKANYDDAKNPARSEDVASYQATLLSAKANLSQAVANRNKSLLISPVDGVVGKIDAKIGEYLSSQDDVLKLVSPHFEVKVDIPETDIIKLSLGDSADVNLDAYGYEVVFRATVTEIEIGETIIQDVVYYTVTLSLADDPTHQILNGMTANVVFFTEEKSGVLYIPQRAVLVKDDGIKYSRVLKDDKIEERDVSVGLRGDGGFVEVLSGLSEGEEVVVRTNGK